MDVIMLLFLITFFIIILYKVKIGKNVNNSFFEKEQSKVIKGICCIVVFLVHVPKVHGNVIQDAIGSFGYICVTIFFLLSAYGLKYSISNKKNYLKNFLRNRVLVIYIPFLIANILKQLIELDNGINFLEIIGLKNISFIGELIIFYIIFYIIYRNLNNKIADYVMVGITIVISLVSYVLKIGWFVECLGFAAGIILYNKEKNINNYFEKNYIIKLLTSIFVSFALGIFYIKMKNIIILNYLLKIILGISIISLLIGLLKKIKINNKILLFLGRISFEIYLLHSIILIKLIELNVLSGIYILITLSITIICASIMNYIDSKIKNAIKT